MSKPRHLLRAWPELRRRLRRAKRRALFTDYDGTLSRIQRRPEQARLGAAMRSALREAAAASDVAGVVSGRRLQDVQSLVSLGGIWYAGVHGHFLRTPRGRRLSLLKSGERRKVARLVRALQSELRRLKGVEVEPKGATVAVHYRRAGRAAAARVRAVALAHGRGEFAVQHGKKVWEFLPVGRGERVNKWTAIEFILRRAGFRSGEHEAVAYLGDDATDEDVFRNLRGITVAVGKRQRTAARYYLRSPGEVRKLLHLWKNV